MADIDSDKEKYGVEYLRQNSTISETSSYKGTPCWIWSKVYSNNDYGAIWIPSLKKLIKVHRWSYICGRGDIPEGSLVRHMCHQKLCCNPIHLETGTHKDNWSDSESTHRTNYTNRRKSHGSENGLCTESPTKHAQRPQRQLGSMSNTSLIFLSTESSILKLSRTPSPEK